MQIVLAPAPGLVRATMLSDGDEVLSSRRIAVEDLPGWVARREDSDPPRWVWPDTAVLYPVLLRAGVRVARCADLRLSRRILRSAVAAEATAFSARPRDGWDGPPSATRAPSDALFDVDDDADQDDAPDPVTEWIAQRAAVAASSEPGQLALLLAAESAGALVAAEMSHAGLPWRADRHDRILTELLGPRPVSGRPLLLEEKADEVRRALESPDLDPDRPQALLRALQTAGLAVESTRAWELRELKHPVIEPLLEYKKLSRLVTANGWNWLDEWVHEGRFRPVYVVGGVVTGRWASDGGGALQLPRQVRGAVRADPGWKLVVADAAQLEPRILAAMSGDAAMARAGQAHDMYEGIVASGAVADRSEAKYGMLGAIYGGTTGVSGRVLPRLRRAFPRAMERVEAAARDGENGRRVRTWLGRTSPASAAAGWDETLTEAQVRRRQSDRRSWGRFTRNFVVQGTAAEWALCWMGALRARLWTMGEQETATPGAAPEPFARRPHLAFFLHDELVVHTPADAADEVAEALREAATEAGRMLFPSTPVEFALSVAIVDGYDEAK